MGSLERLPAGGFLGAHERSLQMQAYTLHDMRPTVPADDVQ